MLEHNKDILWATCFPFTLRKVIANWNFPLGPTAFHFRPHLGVKRAKMWAGSPCADIAPEKFHWDTKSHWQDVFFIKGLGLWSEWRIIYTLAAASLLPLEAPSDPQMDQGGLFDLQYHQQLWCFRTDLDPNKRDLNIQLLIYVVRFQLRFKCFCTHWPMPRVNFEVGNLDKDSGLRIS